MKNNIPSIETMTLREKINQTVVIQMKKGESVDFTPGAAFFFGQIITEAEEAGLEELRGYVRSSRISARSLRLSLRILRTAAEAWWVP